MVIMTEYQDSPIEAINKIIANSGKRFLFIALIFA